MDAQGGVICSGNLVLDILVRPVERIVFDTTTWVESIEQHLGGNGANTSYTLARLGVPVKLLGMVGRDSFGDVLIEKLEAAGVDVSCVERGREATATTVALVDPSGRRAFLHRPGVSAEVFASPIPFTSTHRERFAFYHLANAFGLPLLRTSAAGSLQKARAVGLRTSFDAGWDARGEWMAVLGPCLPFIDLLFVNQDECRMLTGHTDARRAARTLLDSGAGAVVVKLGARGCAVFRVREEFESPGFRVAVIDTTGAGDCFAGGFLAGLYHGLSDLEAARLANATGALSVQRLGSVAGLLSLSEIRTWMTGAVLST
ncbi:MAG: carbohydrate kinase family protein [Bryobacteraceae bacterium]